MEIKKPRYFNFFEEDRYVLEALKECEEDLKNNYLESFMYKLYKWENWDFNNNFNYENVIEYSIKYGHGNAKWFWHFINYDILTEEFVREHLTGFIVIDGTLKKSKSEENLVLPNNLKTIDCEAFLNNDTLKTITIQEGVTEICENAFENCGNLTSIIFPTTLNKIWTKAFHRCINLKSITFPSNLIEIKAEAFKNCAELTEITFLNADTSINSGAFSWCEKLKNIKLPDNITIINDRTFEWCTGLESITIPKSVTKIGDGAFYNCYNLKHIKFESDNDIDIANNSFEYCQHLKEENAIEINNEQIKNKILRHVDP